MQIFEHFADKVVNYLTSLGMGPFEPPKWPVSVEIKEYGKSVNVQSKTLFVHFGEFEIEFIQPISESLHMDFLKSKGEGLHHLAFFVDDLDGAIDKLTKQGLTVTQSGRREKGGGYAYLNTDKHCGIIFELIQR